MNVSAEGDRRRRRLADLTTIFTWNQFQLEIEHPANTQELIGSYTFTGQYVWNQN